MELRRISVIVVMMKGMSSKSSFSLAHFIFIAGNIDAPSSFVVFKSDLVNETLHVADKQNAVTHESRRWK